MTATTKASPRIETPGVEEQRLAAQFVSTTYFHQGTDLLRAGRYSEAEYYLRESLRMRPEDPDTLNNLGTAVWQQSRLEEADSLYRRAYELKPDDYAIVNNLGNSLWEQHRLEEAAKFYQRALALKPDSPETWMNRGVLLTDLSRFDEALECIHESLRLRPDSYEAIANLGATLARQGRWDDAMAAYDRSIRLQQYYPEAHRGRALAWLADGDFERGWSEYEWRLRCRKHVGCNPSCPRWSGEELEGRSILVHAEQGMGDTLMFLRFASALKQRGATVLVACQGPLVRLVARCPFVDAVAEGSNLLPPFDAHSPLLSLPCTLGVTLSTIPAEIPYLSADQGTIEAWRPKVQRALERAGSGNVFRIGIAWQGNPLHRADLCRSFPLRELAPLARAPGVRLLSLQKDDGLDQLRALDGQFAVAELEYPAPGREDRRDFLDTSAIMSELDLVVTADTALAHLAGALGSRVWVALPAVAEWRWLKEREDSPWYPTMRLFRQSSPGDWKSVFERMAEALSQHLRAEPGRYDGRPPGENTSSGSY
jgi:Flp pilus assembly protein TadD